MDQNLWRFAVKGDAASCAVSLLRLTSEKRPGQDDDDDDDFRGPPPSTEAGGGDRRGWERGKEGRHGGAEVAVMAALVAQCGASVERRQMKKEERERRMRVISDAGLYVALRAQSDPDAAAIKADAAAIKADAAAIKADADAALTCEACGQFQVNSFILLRHRGKCAARAARAARRASAKKAAAAVGVPSAALAAGMRPLKSLAKEVAGFVRDLRALRRLTLFT